MQEFGISEFSLIENQLPTPMMTNISRQLTTGALAIAGSVAAFGFGAIAQAATLNATLGFVPFGGVSFTGPTLGTATSVDFAATNLVNTIPDTYDPPGSLPEAPNDFLAGPLAVALGSPVTLSPDPFTTTIGNTLTVSFTTAAGAATFTGALDVKASTGDNALDLFFLGEITGAGFDPSEASLSFAFTRVAGGAINYSATLASPPSEPPVVGTPEPSTILAILAVAGAGAFARRKS
jgi:hypothetical protein